MPAGVDTGSANEVADIGVVDPVDILELCLGRLKVRVRAVHVEQKIKRLVFRFAVSGIPVQEVPEVAQVKVGIRHGDYSHSWGFQDQPDKQ